MRGSEMLVAVTAARRSRSGQAAALRAVYANRSLRRAELAWGGFHFVEWAHLVALAVVAYGAGGAKAVGVVGFARMAPTALATPFAAVVVDRFRRESILLAVHVVRACALGAAAAVLLTGGRMIFVYVLVVVAAIPLAAHRPCHLALAPLLARSPRELVAANVAVMTLESAGMITGPAVAGGLLELSSPGVVFALCAAVSSFSALLVSGVRAGCIAPRGDRLRPGADLREGARAILDNRNIRIVVGLFGAQTLVRGFMSVLLVLVALRLVGLGDPGVGYLNAAFGIGGVVGATAAAAVVGRLGLGRPFQAALALWGLPLAVIALRPTSLLAFAMLALSGCGNSLLDVSGFTAMQEGADGRVLGRVFAVFELLVIVTVGVGWLAAPALVAAVGTRGALFAVGCLLPALALFSHRRLGELVQDEDGRVADIELVRSAAIFAALPFVTARGLAAQLEPLTVTGGTEIVRAGDTGDRFYLIEQGVVRVAPIGGAAARELGPGEGFGEIALLFDVPRTATATAVGPVRLRAIRRDAFLAAVTSHALTLDEANRIVSERALDLPPLALATTV